MIAVAVAVVAAASRRRVVAVKKEGPAADCSVTALVVAIAVAAVVIAVVADVAAGIVVVQERMAQMVSICAAALTLPRRLTLCVQRPPTTN
jgi:hypothetical protein